MKFNISELKKTFINNKKVVENYFFMTLILILNSFFALLIYPYLIRTLGAGSYGIYVFASSIASYFICLVGFGFDMYGVRLIAENPFSTENKSRVLSNIFIAKIYLELIAIFLFTIILFVFPILQLHLWVYIVCFATTLLNILFPTWYFQGVQKMRVVSYIQLFFKLLSLPFIFVWVKTPEDLLLFASIMTSSSLLGAIYAFVHLFIFEKIEIKWVSFNNVLKYIHASQYFFYTNFLNIMKTQALNLIIGAHFGMRDLAIYDLANKIIQIPLILLTSINSALFPKVVLNFNHLLLKRIILIERIIGVLAILGIVSLGKIAISILGGETMEDAYWIAVILSFTIFAFLQTGCYIALILIPKHKDNYVLKDLLVSFISLMFFISIGISVSNHILVLPIAFSLSALVEILYLRSVTKKVLVE